MAPDARIVSVKVGVADGGVDVSQVIAAIDWVVQHRYDNDLNIRVINLSYGTNSAQPSTIDPLAYAAEQAWKAGIFVVAAGGNYGFQSHMNNAPALADPATDRYVMAVGSSDSEGTMTIADDSVPAFSPWPKRGATRGVDLIAPGAHLQGLRVPKSYNDLNHPEGQIDSRFFRGSGTSESAALVSGAAALLYQMYPNAKPDRIKKLLTNAAVAISGKAQAIGGGELQLQPTLTTSLPASVQTWPVSTGHRDPRGRPRPRSPDQRRRRPDRRAGHLRPGLRLARDGRARGRPQQLVGWHVERQQLVRQLVVGQQLVGQLAGPATRWSGNSWSGNSWSGNSWSGNSWSGNSLVGQQLVGQLVVRQQLVDRELGLGHGPGRRAGPYTPGRWMRVRHRPAPGRSGSG